MSSLSVYDTVSHLAPKDITLLILGDSGTGKTFLAKHIHQLSSRKDKPFIKIDCAAIPNSLIESELFGYESGAFTGARDQGKPGLVELADKGTLFLDEIAELPYHLQGKLLQLIQDKTYMRVGGTTLNKVDIRIITATNKDIKNEVKEKRFREDLYYRLAVAVVNIPPLRDRKQDLKAFISYFIRYFNRKYNSHIMFSDAVIRRLTEYDWPGNIRELENLIEYLMVSGTGEVHIDDLPLYILNGTSSEEIENIQDTVNFPDENIPGFDQMMNEYERKMIQFYYPKYESSYKLASALQISQTRANNLIRKHIHDQKPR